MFFDVAVFNKSNQTEWFLNHENSLGDCGTLRALSTAWFVMLHMI